MSSVVDFLEKMGSEAQWRDASADDIEAALAEAGIDPAMSSAILARSAEQVQALLGQVKLVNQYTPTPTPKPHEVPTPTQPDPGKEEEEEESDETSGGSKPSNSACSSPATSTHSSP
jgi:hypothetical protein